MPAVPRDLDGLCPYCEKVASNPVRAIHPFCSMLHRKSHTAGHAKHAERRRVEACACAGEGAKVDGLVHLVTKVRTWQSGKNEHRSYTVYETDWTIACRPLAPVRRLYPPKHDLAVTCLECISGIDTIDRRTTLPDANYADDFQQGTQTGRWPTPTRKISRGQTDYRISSRQRGVRRGPR